MTADGEEAGAAAARGEAGEPPRAQTPCVRVCVVDGTSGLCLGCLRTLREIARWSALSEAERADIMSGLAERRRRVDPAKLALIGGTFTG